MSQHTQENWNCLRQKNKKKESQLRFFLYSPHHNKKIWQFNFALCGVTTNTFGSPSPQILIISRFSIWREWVGRKALEAPRSERDGKRHLLDVLLMITRSILGWGHDELLYEKKKRLRFGSRLESCIHGFSFRLAFALPPSGCLLIGKSSKKESTGVRSRSRILLMRSRIWNPFFLSRLFFIKFHSSNSNFCPFTQKATAGPKKELLLPAVWKVENEKPQKQTKNNLGMLNSHFMILFCYFSSFSPLSSASTFHLGMWKIALKGFLGMMGRMSCVCAMRFHWGSKSHRLDTTPGVKKYKKKITQKQVKVSAANFEV